MSGGEVHKRGQWRRAQLGGPAYGDRSFSEQFKSNELGRFLRDIALIEFRHRNKIGGQVNIYSSHAFNLAQIVLFCHL